MSAEQKEQEPIPNPNDNSNGNENLNTESEHEERQEQEQEQEQEREQPPRQSSTRTPFTNLSQVDADLALARTLQEQVKIFNFFFCLALKFIHFKKYFFFYRKRRI